MGVETHMVKKRNGVDDVLEREHPKGRETQHIVVFAQVAVKVVDSLVGRETGGKEVLDAVACVETQGLRQVGFPLLVFVMQYSYAVYGSVFVNILA